MCIGAVDLHPNKAGVWICLEFVSSVLVTHSWTLTRKLLSNQKRITDKKQCQHPDKSLSQLMLRLRQNCVNLQTIFSNWFLPHNCYSHKFLYRQLPTTNKALRSSLDIMKLLTGNSSKQTYTFLGKLINFQFCCLPWVTKSLMLKKYTAQRE